MKVSFANPLRQTVFEVHSFDVWGNAREGWDINDAYRCGKLIINKKFDDIEPEDVIRALKKHGYIRKTAKDNTLGLDWEYNGWFISDDRKCNHGYPLYRIQNVTEDHMY